MQLDDLFSNYFTVRKELVEAVKDLSEEQLAWHFESHPATIGQLLSHIAGAEAWWVKTVAVESRPYAADEYTRFDRENNSLETCLALLEETLEVTTEFLKGASLDNWDETFYRVRGAHDNGEPFDFKVSLRWLVWHVVEHQARHRGQIFMMLRAQGLEVPHV